MSATLATTIAQVRANLGDSESAQYSDADITQAIREALTRFSQVRPAIQMVSTSVITTGYSFSLAEHSAYLFAVLQVAYPYVADAPPTAHLLDDWFFVRPNNIPAIFRTLAPFEAGQAISIWFTSRHYLSSLDDAEATTLPPNGDLTITIGATAYAVIDRYQRIAEFDGFAATQRSALKTTYEIWMNKFEILLSKWTQGNPLPTGPLPSYGWQLESPVYFAGDGLE